MTITVRSVESIASIPADAWDACNHGKNPFTSHAFLEALEVSGCATAKKGWLPAHLVVENGEGVIGVSPAYLKGHSYGEYVFDWAWAEAYERQGLSYYPKVQSCVPFTPATGPRLLTRKPNDTKTQQAMVQALLTMVDQHDFSSVHLSFQPKEEAEACETFGLMQRVGLQFHWHNRGYETYDDFLGELVARKRKALKKERRTAHESGASIRVLSGDEITPEHWDHFYEFYRRTIRKKWSQAYLNRAFFEELGVRCRDSIVLVMAVIDDTWVGGALNMVGSDTLYGRYWGATENHPGLHFECCYHQAIDLAIARGLSRVEAGAQGEHKLQRGYVPSLTRSSHFIAHPQFRQAIGDFLQRETTAVQERLVELLGQSPFRDDRQNYRDRQQP